MTKKELLYITVIAEQKNISKAAEVLHIAQPSLSNTLQRVESELGVKLFDRTQSGLKTTVAGDYYIETAYSILSDYDSLEKKLSWVRDKKVGRLTVGTTHYLGTIVLPHVITVFQQKYPHIEVKIFEDVSQRVENALLKGDIEISVLHLPVSKRDIICEHLLQEEFLLAVPPNDPIAQKSFEINGRNYIDITLTNERDYILTFPSQRTRQRCNDILHHAGVNPNVKYETKSIQTATRMSGMGLGFTIVPNFYSQLFNQTFMPLLYFIEDAYRPYWDLGVCYSRLSPLSNQASEFINICKEIIPTMYRNTDEMKNYPKL